MIVHVGVVGILDGFRAGIEIKIRHTHSYPAFTLRRLVPGVEKIVPSMSYQQVDYLEGVHFVSNRYG